MCDDSEESCYYSVLGICKQATASEIREAYRRLALVINMHANRDVIFYFILHIKFEPLRSFYIFLFFVEMASG